MIEGRAVAEEGQVGAGLEDLGAREREGVVVSWDLFDYGGGEGVIGGESRSQEKTNEDEVRAHLLSGRESWVP